MTAPSSLQQQLPPGSASWPAGQLAMIDFVAGGGGETYRGRLAQFRDGSEPWAPEAGWLVMSMGCSLVSPEWVTAVAPMVAVPEVPDVEIALEKVRSAGYVAIKEPSHRRAQERQRIAEAMRASAEQQQQASTERWAREDLIPENRRLSARLTHVYGVAKAKGATDAELRGDGDSIAAAVARIEAAKTYGTYSDRDRNDVLDQAIAVARDYDPTAT